MGKKEQGKGKFKFTRKEDEMACKGKKKGKKKK